MTTYQPLVSLQRPVVLDPTIANFEGMRLLVRCLPGDAAKPAEAMYLCRRLRNLFTNQGAEVEIEVPEPGNASGGLDEAGKAAAPPELVIEVRSRLVHHDSSTLLWIISGVTLTLVPAVTESTIASDVTIRDADGALLVSDSLQARFVRYTGVGIWGVNSLLNFLLRSDEEDLGDKATRRDFSRDYFGQLSQLTFHARMRATVLRGFQPPPAAK